MNLQKNQGVTLIAGGMLLIAAGLIMGKADQAVFGLSSDFLAGFLMGAGIALAIAGVAALVGGRSAG
jgi:hypothetical protein